MEEMIAICGLVCTKCPAFMATQNNDNEARERIAMEWSSDEYKLKPEDVNCDGCLSASGKIMNFVEECDVRQCGLEKNVKNCAYCEEYPCNKLDKIFKMAPEAKTRLDRIRKTLL